MVFVWAQGHGWHQSEGVWQTEGVWAPVCVCAGVCVFVLTLAYIKVNDCCQQHWLEPPWVHTSTHTHTLLQPDTASHTIPSVFYLILHLFKGSLRLINNSPSSHTHSIMLRDTCSTRAHPNQSLGIWWIQSIQVIVWNPLSLQISAFCQPCSL